MIVAKARQSPPHPDKNEEEGGDLGEKDKDVDLADEMADVLFVLICLANQTGVNLEKALKENLEKKTKRDSKRHKENKKLK